MSEEDKIQETLKVPEDYDSEMEKIEEKIEEVQEKSEGPKLESIFNSINSRDIERVTEKNLEKLWTGERSFSDLNDAELAAFRLTEKPVSFYLKMKYFFFSLKLKFLLIWAMLKVKVRQLFGFEAKGKNIDRILDIRAKLYSDDRLEIFKERMTELTDKAEESGIAAKRVGQHTGISGVQGSFSGMIYSESLKEANDLPDDPKEQIKKEKNEQTDSEENSEESN